MAERIQNFKNHRRLVFGYHFIGYGLIGLMFAAGIFIVACGHKPLMGLILILNAIILALVGFYARLFALRAQDRAIRAEENLRHFALTGKFLPAGLRVGQIVALRFAPDDEFTELAQRTEKENLKSNEIKKAIKNWRADYHRV